MNSLLFPIFLIDLCYMISYHSCVSTNLHYSGINSEEYLFQNYVKEYAKPYVKGSDEYKHRYQHFLASLKRIELKNKQQAHHDLSAKFGLNKFSDLSSEEFQVRYLSSILFDRSSHSTHNNDVQLYMSSYTPAKLDWRDNHTVTPVKNQETCGGCWAFTSVEVVESAWAISGRKLVPLSVQQVIDCDNSSYGCRGGTPCSTLQWLEQSKAKLVESSVYPFHDAAGTCKNLSGDFGVGVTRYFCESCQGKCPSVEMKKMIPNLVKYGPLSVTVNALSWQDYTGGIIQHHCSYDKPNHSVQIVGYDLTGEIPFWIARNSWGSDFGDHGYLYIKIGENLCGVANAYSGVEKVFS